MSIYKVKCSNEDESVVYAISLVENPANEKQFIFMNKETVRLSLEQEKHLVTGVVLIPNQEIPRYHPRLGEYSLVFGEEEIRLLSRDFFRKGFLHNSNIEHDASKKIDGLTFVESWIVEDPLNDKSNALGFKDLPKGTWMATAYVQDEDTWNKIKSGEVKGFSIEGILETKKIDNLITNKNERMNLKKIFSFLSLTSAIVEFEIDGKQYFAKSLEVGSVLNVLGEDNEVEIASNLEFEFDGKTYKTDENGLILADETEVVEEELESVETEETIAQEVVEEVVENPELDIDEIMDLISKMLDETLDTKLSALKTELTSKITEQEVKIETKLSTIPLATKLGAIQSTEEKTNPLRRIANSNK